VQRRVQRRNEVLRPRRGVKAEPEPTSKRPRAISGETSAATRFVTRLQPKTLKEDPAVEEDLQSLEEMIEDSGKVPGDDEESC
jgi:hypothetical protein